MRDDRIPRILGGRIQAGGFRLLFLLPVLLFLETTIVSLFNGVRTIAPRLGASVDDPNTRTFLAHDGVRYPVEEYLTHLRAFGDEAVLEEMVHELYAVMAIERSKFDRIIRCRR